jgi:pimeloyl-ACP methyl ester carboxylesterase
VTSPNVRDWRDGGRWLHTAVGKVFIRSGPGRAPAVLLLHGYPSSSFDFRAVLPHLADHARVAIDFLGFGLSDKPRPRRYSLLEQADLVQIVAETARVRVGTRRSLATTNVLAGLRELRPSAAVAELPGLGHYPQVEDPKAAYTQAALSLLVE